MNVVTSGSDPFISETVKPAPLLYICNDYFSANIQNDDRCIFCVLILSI
jgi:hypothetical protein